MLARDIMSEPVVTTGPNASVEDAARIMVRHNFSCLPVVDERKRLVGIVTHSDFVLHRRFLPLAEHLYSLLGSMVAPQGVEEAAHRLGTRLVKEVMSQPVVTIREEADFGEVAKVMVGRGVNRLPVMRGDQLVGIITRHDLLKAMVSDS
ncbi:MAG: CBS domain-containing protein [Chloroflexi bacterium]|nr:CBS domain-containing protein [Chloroflexota bacterium]